MITVLAKLIAKPGKESILAEECMALAKEVQANEKDCLMYIPHITQGNPAEITFFEKYATQEAFDVHTQTPYFKAFTEKCTDLLAGELGVQILKELI